MFPLAAEVCNGCPNDPAGRVTTDTKFKVREKPTLALPPKELSRTLLRHMGSYQTLLVHDPDPGKLSEEELNRLCQKSQDCGVGVLVIPSELQKHVSFSGLVLTYDEFFFTVTHLPFLFNSGVLCVFTDNQAIGAALYSNLRKLETLKYPEIIYCNKDFRLSVTGKTLAESTDGYSISLNKF